MRVLGRFEWKIISALLLTAAAPLLFTFFMVDKLVEESMSVGLNDRVLTGLRDGVKLYKEVIESRIHIARLQGQFTANLHPLIKTLEDGDNRGTESILEDLVASSNWISEADIVEGDDTLIRVVGPVSFAKDKWKFKSDQWPINDRYSLKITFVISKDFLAASGKLRDLVETMESIQENFQPWKMGYYRLFLFIYFFILIAAVILGYLLSRSVTKRIASLVEATKLASGGDLDARVNVRSSDEIGMLAKSFNQMMDDIRRGRDRIMFLEKISSWQEIARRMAHEIKNPLTPIQLAIQELHRSYRGQDESFRAKLNDSLEIVEEEVGTLRRMVKTFTEFARMPAVQVEPVELNAFISDFIKHNPQYSDKIDLSLSNQTVMVKLDRGLMGRVLGNLIDNGIQASDDDEMLEISVGAAGEWGFVSVRDHGSGLAPEARQKLFQPYFTTKPYGTGLGLAIVKKIVLQHAGEISVSDGEKGGTVFTVRLRIT